MARFYPVYTRRSDGVSQTITKGTRKEKNQPTEEQMDAKPDKNGVSDFYREVTPDEVKSLDWRRKLGGMLARELRWNEKNAGGSTDTFIHDTTDDSRDSGYILVSFPEHYRLFEHVKKSEKDGKTEVKSKTHAAGGNDRQDAYLYGHPLGRRKRYRSPADFFPHLLWLCTDESGDPDNCSCKICCPEELENIVPGAKAVKAEKQRTEVAKAVKTEPAKAVKQESKVSELRNAVPTPLPKPQSLDQQIDSQHKNFKYRQGEMAWFRRGQAWGLGVILRRWHNHDKFYYSVQPLSYPNHKQTTVTLGSDNDMRPWLAWSVPRYTYAVLNDLTPAARYDNVDWQRLAQGAYGPNGDLDVDGSILAAKSIDSSYTPISPAQSREISPGYAETYYEGLYLGAEKIWRGDPVRLTIGTGIDIMIVQHIVERSIRGQSEQIQLIGDVYQLTSVPHPDPNVPTPASPLSNPQLPQRLTEDLAYRNARSIQARQTAHYWKLVSTQTHCELNHVKGRWYESSLWLPILQPDTFKIADQRGEIQELSLYMNSRGDCLQANRNPDLPRVPRMNLRRSTRVSAFMQAVPAGTQIVDGIAPPKTQSIDPALSSEMDIDSRFGTDDGGNLDQFMNLDGNGGYYG